MKRVSGIVSLSLLLALVWTYGTPAVDWEHVYEGNEIPDSAAMGDKVWNIFITGGAKSSDVCEITPDEELHIIDPADKVCFFIYEDIGEVGKATVEARVKVLSQSGADYTILMGIEDAVGYAWLDLFPDHIQIEGGPSHDIDMTEYHILRISRDENDVRVYVDDEQVLEGVLSTSSGRHDIIFGSGSTGGTGDHYWDYVAFTTAGAFSPEDLPNFESTIALVESKGKAAACWGMIKSGY